jgi:uncharacterized protein YcbK (DUF882 family)
MNLPNDPTRRRFMRRATHAAGTAALAGLGLPQQARATAADATGPVDRMLEMVHTHTRETIKLVYAVGSHYLPPSLQALDRFLRDHYTGDVGRIDPQLFDLLHRLRQTVGASGAFEVISGYRCPGTNDRLRSTRGGGVARHSLHMEGRAIDVRCRGVPLADLRDAALSLRGGGVGYYPQEAFVHLDTGRVRAW